MYYKLAADTWDDEEKAAIADVIASGRFTMGPKVAEFERAFAKSIGRKYAVMVNSGSSANLVGIASLFFRKHKPLQRGDEAIVPAIAWSTTYSPLQQYGMRLKFVDVELDTLNMDVKQLEAALTPRTRLVMGVSILGNPAALDVMRAFADKHGLVFFEDNCESLGAELNGKPAGTFGDISTFSTFFSHHISTGEGGIATTDDAELDALMRAIRAHGWTRDVPGNVGVYEPWDDEFKEAYRFILPGYNVRPQELNAAVGIVQLKKVDAMTEARRKNMALFNSLFGADGRFIIQREHGKSSSFSFTIILNPDRNIDRDRVFAALRDADIGFRMVTGGCYPRHEAIKHYDYELVGGATKNADIVHDYGFFIGNHPFDLSEQIRKAHQVLDRACN
jgi:CDP-6-deoxy-D-xylo-4-hexulose-3-dehydrase